MLMAQRYAPSKTRSSICPSELGGKLKVVTTVVARPSPDVRFMFISEICWAPENVTQKFPASRSKQIAVGCEPDWTAVSPTSPLTTSAAQTALLNGSVQTPMEE